ncbi:hypothetical protein [Bradyrhizobium sp. SZCCHNS3002]|nr:hypothetical protein [Bradyrhizobium sp. SZCCHNS3002]
MADLPGGHYRADESTGPFLITGQNRLRQCFHFPIPFSHIFRFKSFAQK